MGKVDDALTFLAVKRMNTGIYQELSVENKKIYMDKLKRDIDDELRAKALQECLMTRYRAYYNKLLDEGEDEDILPIIKELNDDRKNQEELKEDFKSDYCFITVNPRPGSSLTEFKTALDKSVKKSFIKKSLYVIEQRGETMEELGNGFHAHILVNKGDYRYSHTKREFASTFKKFCDTTKSSCFNVKSCKEKDIRNRQNYMIGRKADPAKWLKQDMDIIFRKNHYFQSYYGELFEPDIGELAAGF